MRYSQLQCHAPINQFADLLWETKFLCGLRNYVNGDNLCANDLCKLMTQSLPEVISLPYSMSFRFVIAHVIDCPVGKI